MERDFLGRWGDKSSKRITKRTDRGGMMNEARIAIRSAGFLLAQRGFHILGSLLFAVFVPRLMGPNDYGRYALITSLSFWFIMLSDLGFPQIMGRYTPLFILQGEKEKLQKFFTNILTVSLVSGALVGCLYLLFTSLCLPDIDLFLFITIAVTIVVRAAVHPFFTLFLGLNQAARWGMGEIFRHGLTIVTVLIGFYLSGLQGACLGLFLTELVVLSIGIGWGKSYLSWKDLRLDFPSLIPYLRFGFMFFAAGYLTWRVRRIISYSLKKWGCRLMLYGLWTSTRVRKPTDF